MMNFQRIDSFLIDIPYTFDVVSNKNVFSIVLCYIVAVKLKIQLMSMMGVMGITAKKGG